MSPPPLAVMADVSLLMMRLGYAALLLAFHGGPRFLHAFQFVARGEPWGFVDVVGQMGLPFASAFAVASAASESIGAALVAAGWWTRLAAASIAINMTVALIHEGAKGDPIELPALYLLGALTLLIAGAGRFSVDSFRAPARRLR
jgi:uncharacterized membrane protein YphA (DoxX/SURF4 family)